MAKKKRYQDPHAAREAARYDNPVPSRELIIQLLNEHGKPLTVRDFRGSLRVTGEDAKVAFERPVAAGIRDGQLVKNRKGRYGLASRMDLICGRIQEHRDGFGFVIPEQRD